MSIFGNLFGDKTLDNIENSIENILNKLPSVDQKKNIEDATGSFINVFTDNVKDDEINKILEEAAVPRDRLMRYVAYEELYRAVPIIKRIFKVYKPNILQKNPVTGKCFMIKDNEDSKKSKETKEDKQKLEDAKKFSNEIVEQFNLIDKLKNKIIHMQLLYGDTYIEVVDVNDEADKFELSKVMGGLNVLTEDAPVLKDDGTIRENIHPNIFDSDEQLFENLMLLTDQYSRTQDLNQLDGILQNCANQLLSEDSSQDIKKNKDDENTTSFDNILLKIHKPHNIIVLETEYGSRVGYLEVNKQQELNTANITQNLSMIVGRVTNMNVNNGLTQEKIVNKLIFYILKKVLSKKSNVKNPEQVLKGLGPETYSFLKKIMIEQGINKKLQLNQLKVRFIPSDHMIPFSMNSSEFSPYGESIVDPLVFPCKLYVIAQLSNTITKLSRSAVMRKWSID